MIRMIIEMMKQIIKDKPLQFACLIIFNMFVFLLADKLDKPQYWGFFMAWMIGTPLWYIIKNK